ncbi:MAG: hypothetical protein ACHQ50_13215 [Fimbriimonadales bacterium]
MLALAAAIAFQNNTLPEKAVVAYSGIPKITGQNIAIQSHTVTITVSKEFADVSSLTLIKNNGAAGNAVILIPGFQTAGTASVPSVSATWTNIAVPLLREPMMSIPEARNPSVRFSGSGPMQNLGTYALRISYRLPIGRSGFDHKQYLGAYDLTSPVPIGTLMVTYNYAKGVVFHEPEAGPNLGWQVGEKGAFVKVVNYDGKAGLSYCAFYSGGFGG